MKTSQSYPHITSKADYRRFRAAFKRGIKGLKFISNGHCPDCENCTEGEDSHFSHSPCDICHRYLGGDRYPAHGYLPFKGKDELCHLDICPDCRYYMEYGQLDDMTMLDYNL